VAHAEHFCLLLDLFFNPGDGGNTFVWDVTQLVQKYAEQHKV
jgi:hypothetical protein